MATHTNDCPHKGSETVCPKCGRSAPDWCGLDHKDVPEQPLVESAFEEKEDGSPVTPEAPRRGRKAASRA